MRDLIAGCLDVWGSGREGEGAFVLIAPSSRILRVHCRDCASDPWFLLQVEWDVSWDPRRLCALFDFVAKTKRELCGGAVVSWTLMAGTLVTLCVV
jgi:hypothetical protein